MKRKQKVKKQTKTNTETDTTTNNKVYTHTCNINSHTRHIYNAQRRIIPVWNGRLYQIKTKTLHDQIKTQFSNTKTTKTRWTKSSSLRTTVVTISRLRGKKALRVDMWKNDLDKIWRKKIDETTQEKNQSQPLLNDRRIKQKSVIHMHKVRKVNHRSKNKCLLNNLIVCNLAEDYAVTEAQEVGGFLNGYVWPKKIVKVVEDVYLHTLVGRSTLDKTRHVRTNKTEENLVGGPRVPKTLPCLFPKGIFLGPLLSRRFARKSKPCMIRRSKTKFVSGKIDPSYLSLTAPSDDKTKPSHGVGKCTVSSTPTRNMNFLVVSRIGDIWP